MMAEDATVAAEETVDGSALRFTTTGDVAELRRRVADRAAKHAAMHGHGCKHMGQNAPDGHAGAMAHPEMMASDVKVEDVEGGARLIFTPRDATRLDPLRAEVREHATMMASKKPCPMMGHSKAH